MGLVNIREVLQYPDKGIASDAAFKSAHALISDNFLREEPLRRLDSPLVEAAQPGTRRPPDICDLRLRHQCVCRRCIENLPQVPNTLNIL